MVGGRKSDGPRRALVKNRDAAQSHQRREPHRIGTRQFGFRRIDPRAMLPGPTFELWIRVGRKEGRILLHLNPRPSRPDYLGSQSMIQCHHVNGNTN